MMKHAGLIAAIAGAAAVGAYALSRFGRAAVRSELTGGGWTGAGEAGDVANSLTFVEAMTAGARKLTQQSAFPASKIAEIYTVS